MMDEPRYPYPAVEETLEFTVSHFRVRLWIDIWKTQEMGPRDRAINYAAMIRARVLHQQETPLAEELARWICRELPEVAAVQVVEHVGEGVLDRGIVIYAQWP